MFTVKVGLRKLPPDQLLERGRAHIIALTGNPWFPNPLPSIPSIISAFDALDLAQVAFLNNGGRMDRLARDERARDLKFQLTLLGSYVQSTSGGDPEKIMSAGFPLRKRPAPMGILPAPGNLRARLMRIAGMVGLVWRGVKGRQLYEVFICHGDPLIPGNWRRLSLCTKNYFHARGIDEPRTCFRVRAFGAAGPGPWSDVAVGW